MTASLCWKGVRLTESLGKRVPMFTHQGPTQFSKYWLRVIPQTLEACCSGANWIFATWLVVRRSRKTSQWIPSISMSSKPSTRVCRLSEKLSPHLPKARKRTTSLTETQRLQDCCRTLLEETPKLHWLQLATPRVTAFLKPFRPLSLQTGPNRSWSRSRRILLVLPMTRLSSSFKRRYSIWRRYWISIGKEECLMSINSFLCSKRRTRSSRTLQAKSLTLRDSSKRTKWWGSSYKKWRRKGWVKVLSKLDSRAGLVVTGSAAKLNRALPIICQLITQSKLILCWQFSQKRQLLDLPLKASAEASSWRRQSNSTTTINSLPEVLPLNNHKQFKSRALCLQIQTVPTKTLWINRKWLWSSTGS